MGIAAITAISAIASLCRYVKINVQDRPAESWQDRERRLRSRGMCVPRESERKKQDGE
jgi:hypothetical protein